MNKYYEALQTRIDNVKANNSLSATNVKKLETAQARMKAKDVVALLDKCEVSETFAQRNVYMIEKLAVYAMNALKLDPKFNQMSKHIFLTAMRCAEHDVPMTKKDAQDACSKDRKVEDDRKHLVVQRRDLVDASTVNAQHQSSVAALLELNVLTAATKDTRDAIYSVNADNAAYKALSAQMQA